MQIGSKWQSELKDSCEYIGGKQEESKIDRQREREKTRQIDIEKVREIGRETDRLKARDIHQRKRDKEGTEEKERANALEIFFRLLKLSNKHLPSQFALNKKKQFLQEIVR